MMLPAIALSEGFRITVKGLVQGVGFRPFVKRLATDLGLTGRIWNSRQGVEIELLADDAQIHQFVHSLYQSPPKLARIDNIDVQATASTEHFEHFFIEVSDPDYQAADIPPDQAMCKSCRCELFDTSQRRHDFAFNSCSDCGPRFSIIKAMPYDRQTTAMQHFPLCSACEHEFNSATERRFHTEAMACPECGPTMKLLNAEGKHIDVEEQGILATCSKWLSQGKILAIKGIGGFHLCCDSYNLESVELLRRRKRRPSKPFAVMMPDIEQVQAHFELTEVEKSQLSLAAAPIVLLPKSRAKLQLPEILAPGVAHLGVMLAYSPLHLLLLNAFNQPLLMTSGNRGGEPLCIDEHQALKQLTGLADGFVCHDREIVNRCDDSLLKVINGIPRMLRRARGYVPEGIPFRHSNQSQPAILAMGADLKNCFALTCNNKIVLSGHNGDIAEPGCYQQTAQQISQFRQLLNITPQIVVVDKHPDYFSSRLGRKLAHQEDLRVIEVQHHHAHLASCLLENQIYPSQPVLGIVLDGLGYGDDDTLWGGEMLLADFHTSHRLGCLTPFPLLGAEQANRQPWRNLLALLDQAGLWSSLTKHDLINDLMQSQQTNEAERLLSNRQLFPLTSSAGRLFDAVAALLGITPAQQSYEGEAAMQLEALALTATQRTRFAPLADCLFDINNNDGLMQLDPSPIWLPMIEQLKSGTDKADIALWFHQCFVKSWVELIKQVKLQSLYEGDQVVLSGGVFQNQLVLEFMQQQLQAIGYRVYSHCYVPSNDGGLALGQCAIALAQLEQTSCV
jgi:hydrogenase maturation protein HypF